MKLVIALLFCIVAAASASGYYSYDYGFDKPQNFARERQVNLVNGKRQAYVNHVAVASGASDGTYPRDGVPGTGVGNGYRAGGYRNYAGNYKGYTGYAADPNAYIG